MVNGVSPAHLRVQGYGWSSSPSFIVHFEFLPTGLTLADVRCLPWCVAQTVIPGVGGISIFIVLPLFGQSCKIKMQEPMWDP